jgi:hypothetical protein
MSTYRAAKHSYNFVTSFEIFNSWSNSHNLSCYIKACCDVAINISSAKKQVRCVCVNACLANTEYC